MEISSQTAQEKYEQAQASVRQTASFRHDGKPHCRPAPVGTEAGSDGASELSRPIGRGVGTAFAPEFYCQPDSQHDFSAFRGTGEEKWMSPSA